MIMNALGKPKAKNPGGIPRGFSVFIMLLMISANSCGSARPPVNRPTAKAASRRGFETAFRRKGYSRRNGLAIVERGNGGRMEGMVLECSKRTPGQPLNALEHHDFLCIAKRKRGPGGSCAGGAPDPVYIAFRVVRHIIVDHMRYPVHIDPPGDDIGADQDLDLSVVEGGQGALAGALCLVGMDRVGGNPLARKLPHDAVGPPLRPRENQRSSHIIFLQNIRKKIMFILMIHEKNFLVDMIRNRSGGGHIDTRRILQHTGGESSRSPGKSWPKKASSADSRAVSQRSGGYRG